MKTFVKPLYQIYPNRQAVKNVHIDSSSIGKGLHLKSNRFEQNIQKFWRSGERRTVATFYLCSKRWSWSPAMESIQAGLETVESLKTLVDEDIDLLDRASKENNDVELGEEADFDDETITLVRNVRKSQK